MKQQNLLQFIDSSSTAFHAVETVIQNLDTNFISLNENETWDIKPNTNYYITRADASILLVKTPKNITKESLFKIIGAHTDSPCFKIKSNSTSTQEGYQLLNIEVYGGVIINSWFDKDLLIGGRVFLEDSNGKLTATNVKLPYKIRIPRLAIHLDRGVNSEGFKINAQIHTFPVMGLGEQTNLNKLIQKELQTNAKIISWDLYLFDAEKSSLGGINNEFIYAPRLDNLASVHSSLQAILKSENHSNDFLITAYFHHEEIGSSSQNGAGSNFLEATLQRISNQISTNKETYFKRIADSFFISADMAHAVHPSYSYKHDANHKPYMEKGPVIKSNANMRYATDAFSIAKFIQWCNTANVPYQNFCSSNDVGCGSTIGPMTAAQLGIPTIDIGNPMLSMHSIREMAALKDHNYLIEVFKAFFKG